MMSFFDWEPNSLPAQAQYFFNIVVVIILADNETMDELIGKGIQTYWNIENITEPRPYVIGLVRLTDEEIAAEGEEFGEELQYIMEIHSHCVVEVDPQLGVSWYNMFNDEESEQDPWRL